MNNWQGKRVFISGGAGVIGTQLVKMLTDLGSFVFVGDLKPRPMSFPLQVKYRQGDLNYIREEELLAFEPEVFFHLAATFERSTESYDFWGENFDHNVRLSHYLMSLLKKCVSLKKVIFASSYLIYDPKLYIFDKPQQKAIRLDEQTPIYPRNLCGVAKLNHEIELRFLETFNKHVSSFVSVRIFRGYGCGSRDIISRWVRDALAGKSLNVFNEDGLFDYIYAEDTALGLIKIAESTFSGVINLGSDGARRVRDIVQILQSLFPALHVEYGDSKGPYEASQANMDAFHQVTGWKPQYRLEEAIPLIVEFEKKQQKLEVLPAYVARPKVLVSSVSKKVGLLSKVQQATAKILLSGSVIGGDSNEDCLAHYFTDDFIKMCPLSELSDEKLLAMCKQKNITHIIPTRDGELLFWAQKKQMLAEHGIAVMISDLYTVEVCLDKLLFYQVLSKCGINVIQTELDEKKITSNLVVVKERFGAGSLSIGLNLSRDQAVSYAKNLQHPIFQPYIQGCEYSIDVYVDQNKQCKGMIIRQRIKVVHGESQITTTVRHAQLEMVCNKLVESLNFYGHLVIQAFVTANNDVFIIECNSRFGGASTISIDAGLDSFYWFLLEGMGVNVGDYPFIPLQKSITQIRYPQDKVVYGDRF